jgi:hypothetical protein
LSGIELQSDDVIGHIDELRGSGDSSAIAARVDRGGFVTIRGWLLDRGSQRPPDSIAVNFGAGPPVEAVIGLPRPDVEAAFGFGAARSGFAVAVPANSECGACTLSLRPLRAGRSSAVELKDVVTIVAPADPFAGLEGRAGRWVVIIDGIFAGELPVPRDASGVFVVDLQAPAELCFWAIDAETRRAPEAIVARFGGRYLRVTSTIARPDAAASQSAPGAAMCGFAVPFVPSPIGIDRVELYALDDEGSFAHIASVRARQAQPLPASVLPDASSVRGAVDALEVAGAAVRAADRILAVPGQALVVRGWAIDANGPRLCGGVDVLIDGKLAGEAQTLLVRNDIAAKFAHPRLAESGFEVSAVVPDLEAREVELAVWVYSARRDAATVLLRRPLAGRSRR